MALSLKNAQAVKATVDETSPAESTSTGALASPAGTVPESVVQTSPVVANMVSKEKDDSKLMDEAFEN